MAEIQNLISVDVEDWFQVESFASAIAPSDWSSFELRVRPNLERLLALLDRKRTRCTFFTLGWIAEREQELIRQIASAGHEIASHGWSHTPIWNLSPDQFAIEIRRSKQLLEDLSRQTVRGYRAPTFSMTRRTLWALPLLREAGYTYDSSIFPITHDRYGISDAPLEIHFREEGLWEIPMSVMELGGYRLPVAGGGYFRLYPYALTRRAIRSMHARGRPAIVYLHPWEFDPDQPRFAGVGLANRLRHYYGIGANLQKLERLLDDFSFSSAREVLSSRGAVV